MNMKYLDEYLEKAMDAPEGEELKYDLDKIIAEEKMCLEQFEFQIDFCNKQIGAINARVDSVGPTHDIMVKKRAFEEEIVILNVAAMAQRCSFETKGIQRILYFEKNVSSKERVVVDANTIMYEWCKDLLELTGKKYQDIAKGILSESALVKIRVARKRLGNFFKQEEPVLSKVRHNVGAHHDHDFMKEMEILEGIGWAETIKRLHYFEEVTLELGSSMKPLMDAGLKQIGKVFGK